MTGKYKHRLALFSLLLLSACSIRDFFELPPEPTKISLPYFVAEKTATQEPDLTLTEILDAPGVSIPTIDDDQSPVEPGYLPRTEDESRERMEIEVQTAELYMAESFPPQPFLHLSGELPTPCHELRILVNPPDDTDQIHVVVYSVADPTTVCVQVLEPFDISIPLSNIPSGQFTVFVNGRKVAGLLMP